MFVLFLLCSLLFCSFFFLFICVCLFVFKFHISLAFGRHRCKCLFLTGFCDINDDFYDSIFMTRLWCQNCHKIMTGEKCLRTLYLLIYWQYLTTISYMCRSRSIRLTRFHVWSSVTYIQLFLYLQVSPVQILTLVLRSIFPEHIFQSGVVASTSDDQFECHITLN